MVVKNGDESHGTTVQPPKDHLKKPNTSHPKYKKDMLCTCPLVNQHGKGRSTIWRCISYLEKVDFHCQISLLEGNLRPTPPLPNPVDSVTTPATTWMSGWKLVNGE